MPGVERYNLSGRNPQNDNSDLSPQRSEANRLNTQQDVESNDARWAQQAESLKDTDPAGARTAAENIIDPQRRVSVFKELFPNGNDMSAPGEVFLDGVTGISDPLALFFMMVLYLDKPAPTINWNDILRAARASDAGNDAFALLPNNDDGYMSQRLDFKADNAPIVDSTKKIQVPIEGSKDENGNPLTRTTTLGAQRDLNAQTRAQATATATKDQTDQQERNKENAFTTGQWNPSRGEGANGMVVWPIQNMPRTDGISKSVDWNTIKIPGGADPLISNNEGADNIELNLEFTYAVGLAGIGDGEDTLEKPGRSEDQKEPDHSMPRSASSNNFWTVEDVMGMMYLASSLVYPFKATAPLIGDDGKPTKQTVGANQFPVIFLRHYSLFPFLTPFVVKCVKIEPDEDQPLIITNPQRMNAAGTHLSFPAVRQVVKISITLLSAHNYITLFSEKDPNGQLAIQTSGQTYRNLAATLLGGRI